MKTGRLQYVGFGLITALAYVASAKLGFTLAFVAEQVTIVWPPTGIALCAVLLLGYRIWPAIAIGAFVANITTDASASASLGITVGNTLEAVVGAYLLQRFVGFRPSLERFKDAFGLVCFGAIVSTTVSATLGVTSLCLTGAQPWQKFGSLWGVWFVGDAMGDVIVVPLILTLVSAESRRRIRSRGLPEFAALLSILIVVQFLVFDHRLPLNPEYYPPVYVIFPLLIWAALRFGTCGTAIAVFLTSTIAVFETGRGLGPFTLGTTSQQLITLQLFMFIAACTSLIMAVSQTQRDANRSLLDQANRRKDEFLAMLAHELRNPIAPIRSAVDIIRASKHDSDRIDRTCDLMDRQVQNMSRLLDDLLDIARVTRGQIELKKEPADLAIVVSRSVEAIRPTLEKKAIELVTDVVPDPVAVSADVTRLDQIVINLLNNAVKFTHTGGRISVGVNVKRDSAVLRVSDNGRGIDPKLLPHIFEPFVQGDRSLARSEGGLGIGLTLVQNLVQMHSGTIEATSDGLGRGTEFTVTFPLIPAALLPSPRKAVQRATTIQKKRVLVVEDNADSAETLAAMLDIMGHEAHVAHDGRQGLAEVARLNPSVVLLDIGLPGMTGLEVAAELRSNNTNSALTLIALTGYGSDTDRARSKEAGFDYHLVKPVDFGALEKLLK
jgi:signal transduction histidine kinase/CheY-like chemotaxis protein